MNRYANMLLFGTIVILMLFLAACTAVDHAEKDQADITSPQSSEKPQSTPDPVHDAAQPESPKPPERAEPIVHQATLAAVGDIIVYSSMWRDAATENGFDFLYMFEHVKQYFAEADVVFANQETMIGGESLGLSDYPRFNSPFAIADALKEIGVSIVSIANNHTLDRGVQAVENGAAYWNELGIPYTGAYPSEEDAKQIRTIEAGGIRFAFLAYTYGTNGIPLPPDKPWIVNLLDEEKIKSDIASAKELADIVVVSYHFGNEYERMPNEAQKHWAQIAADSGAHIVLGHHPHVLQPLEWRQQPNGERTLVAYSLGNFLAAQEGIYKDLGGILLVEIEKTVTDEDTSITIHTPDFIPTWIHKKNWRDYRIIPLHQVSEDVLPNARKHEEEMISHLRTWMPDLNFPYSND